MQVPSAATPALSLRGLAGERAGRPLFRDLNLDLAPGELLHVHGPNGSGKTSLLRIVCGLLPAAAGQVGWAAQAPAASGIVYLSHALGLKDELTPCENLITDLALAGRRVNLRQARQALLQAGLGSREDRPVRLLSQGQRRRAALARLPLSGAAPLWVLDEPCTALDTAACQWLGTLIGHYLRRGGMVLLTSHQPVPLETGLALRHLDLGAPPPALHEEAR